jgi:hypothetical protein
MRIWSLHPRYLDAKGLVALWRETLLAKKVLEGKTNAYRYHPQLHRFKIAREPLYALNYYLHYVWVEAKKRSYSFDKNKYIPVSDIETMEVTAKQLNFERRHLLDKLKLRDENKYNEIVAINNFETHPLFKTIAGEIESWEKT